MRLAGGCDIVPQTIPRPSFCIKRGDVRINLAKCGHSYLDKRELADKRFVNDFQAFVRQFPINQGRKLYSCLPESVIRDPNESFLLPCRLAAAFADGVAGYVETKRQARCRQENESVWKAEHSYNNKYLAV